MGLKLELDKTGFEKTLKLYKKSHREAVVKSVKRGIERTLPTLQRVSWKLLKRKMRLPKLTQKQIIKRIKPKLDFNINNMEGQVVYHSKSISLIKFVKGKKTPRAQKGKKVKSRGQLKYEVKPGSTKKGGSMFIAKVSGGFQVFRRMGDSTHKKKGSKKTQLGIRKMVGPNPAIVIRHSAIKSKLLKIGAGKLQKEYNKSLLGLLQKMKDGK